MTKTTEPTVPVELSGATLDAVIVAFSDSADTVANRVFTVGPLTSQPGITAKDVFTQVQARIELTDAVTVKGWSSSSVANAKTSYDLYVASGVSTTIKRADRNALAKLIEDTRVRHGAKIIKLAIADATANLVDDILPADRYDVVMSVLTALRFTAPADKPDNAKSTEDKLIAALNAALALSESAELNNDQAELVSSILRNIADKIA